MISKTEKTNTSIMSQFNKFISYCIFTCIFSRLCICIFFFILSVLVFHTIKTTESQFFE